MREFECNITIDDKFITIKPNANGEAIVKFHGQLSDQEMAAVNVITQTVKCLLTRRPIDYYFNPTVLDADESLVKCEWMRSGKLVVRATQNVDKKHQHANTIAEALMRKRVFTCPRWLLRQLPRQRGARTDA